MSENKITIKINFFIEFLFYLIYNKKYEDI